MQERDVFGTGVGWVGLCLHLASCRFHFRSLHLVVSSLKCGECVRASFTCLLDPLNCVPPSLRSRKGWGVGGRTRRVRSFVFVFGAFMQHDNEKKRTTSPNCAVSQQQASEQQQCRQELRPPLLIACAAFECRGTKLSTNGACQMFSHAYWDSRHSAGYVARVPGPCVLLGGDSSICASG